MDNQIILPGVQQKTWLHTDGAGNDNVTIEVVQDAAPVIKDIRDQVQAQGKTDMPLLAKIPVALIQETAKQAGQVWGLRTYEAFGEIVRNKTDRAQAIWKELLKGRDYRKLQASNY